MDTTTKTCKSCGKTKGKTEFRLQRRCRDGRTNTCKECFWDRYKEKEKLKYLQNREKHIQKAKQWRKNNKDRYRELSRKYKKKPIERAKRNLRNRLKELLVNKETSYDGSVGCTRKELASYLESKFQSGMSWDNYGKGDKFWVIDHIKPLALFDLTDREQRHAANHYTNLQPLWSLHNELKSNNYDPDHPMGWKGLDELIER